MMDQMRPILEAGLGQLGLDTGAVPALTEYARLLLETNQVMNLTAITDPKDVATLHFLDCASLLALADFTGKTVADVGSGAGFPGLPLKILCPSIQLIMVDSLGKRVNFLQTVCDALHLTGVEAIHARAEEIPEGYRDSFDFALSRAVARLNILCELCLPYVKKGGAFIAMKGSDLDQELKEAEKAIALLGGKVEQKLDYTIPGTDVTHSLLIIRKLGNTAGKYPRRWAQIKKSPL